MYPIKSQRKGPQLRHDDNSEKTTPQHRLIIWQSFSHLNALSSPSLSLSVGGSVRSAHDTCLISTIIALKFAETMPLDNVRSRATHKDLHHALSHTITERECVWCWPVHCDREQSFEFAAPILLIPLVFGVYEKLNVTKENANEETDRLLWQTSVEGERRTE